MQKVNEQRFSHRAENPTDSRHSEKRQEALSQATNRNQEPTQTPPLMWQLKALAD